VICAWCGRDVDQARLSLWHDDEICADCFATWYDDPDRTPRQVAGIVHRRRRVLDWLRVALWLLIGFLLVWLLDNLFVGGPD
jgi:hypothetical protein